MHVQHNKAQTDNWEYMYVFIWLSSSSTTVNFQARPLLVSELGHSTVSQCIAKKMAELHCMKLPMKKTPTELWENIER